MDKIAFYKEEIYKEAKEKVDYLRSKVNMGVPFYSAGGQHWNDENEVNTYTDEIRNELANSPLTAKVLENYNKTKDINNATKKGMEIASIPASLMTYALLMNGMRRNPSKAMQVLLNSPAKTLAAVTAPAVAIQMIGGAIGGGKAMIENKTSPFEQMKNSKKVKALDVLLNDRILERGREGIKNK